VIGEVFMRARAASFNAIFGFCLLVFGLPAAGADGGAASPVLALFAGSMSGEGSADGTRAAARFNRPSGVATDRAGNVYVADAGNHTIRKITAAGVVSTLAGTADGEGFDVPEGVATDSAGNVYVADTYSHTIRKITPARVVSIVAGYEDEWGSTDETGGAARFNFPRGVATDSAGNVYVADSDNHTIRKITADEVVSTLAGMAGEKESIDGAGETARFNSPFGVATDSAGDVYVTDAHNHTVRKITPAGVVSTLAGSAGVRGSVDGTGEAARFYDPSGVATDSAGNVYVADTGNCTIRKITAAGVVSTVVGAAGQPGFVPGALPGRIGCPKGVAVSGTSLYLTFSNVVAVVRNRP
jgi:sugar lactone lactonase YvrE